MQDEKDFQKRPSVSRTPEHHGCDIFPTWAPTGLPSFSYPARETMENMKSAGNMAIKIVLTCAGVVFVSSPIKTLIIRGMAKPIVPAIVPAIVPTSASAGAGAGKNTTGQTTGVFSNGYRYIAGLYAGSLASLNGQALRSSFVVGAKAAHPSNITEKIGEGSSARIAEEFTAEEEASTLTKRAFFSNTGALFSSPLAYGSLVGAVELALTQISESASILLKRPEFLPKGFKLTGRAINMQLFRAGIEPRYVSAVVNFLFMSTFSDSVRDSLPSYLQGKKRSFIAGGVSGAAAAVVTYPLATFKDYVLLQATINGTSLQIPGTLSVAKKVFNYTVQNPNEALTEFANAAFKNAPLRIGMNAAVFSMVIGIEGALGDNPIGEALGDAPKTKVSPEEDNSYQASSRLTFFGAPTKASLPTIEDNPQAKPPSTPTPMK